MQALLGFLDLFRPDISSAARLEDGVPRSGRGWWSFVADGDIVDRYSVESAFAVLRTYSLVQRRHRTPSSPSEALENVPIVVLAGPILADTDDTVEEVVVVGGPILAETDDAVEGGGGGSGRTAIEAGADFIV